MVIWNAIEEYGKNGSTEEAAVYEGTSIGHAFGTIVRETLGIDSL